MLAYILLNEVNNIKHKRRGNLNYISTQKAIFGQSLQREIKADTRPQVCYHQRGISAKCAHTLCARTGCIDLFDTFSRSPLIQTHTLMFSISTMTLAQGQHDVLYFECKYHFTHNIFVFKRKTAYTKEGIF